MPTIPQKTRDILLQQKPYLQIYFQPLPQSRCFTLQTDQKTTFITYNNQGQSTTLASRYNPQKDIANICQELPKTWQSGEIIVVFGLGNLLLLEAVEKRLEKGQICIVIDAFFELGQLLCQQSSVMWNFLMRPGSHLFCGETLYPSLQHYLGALPIDGLNGVSIVKYPPSIRLARDNYDYVEELLSTTIKARMSDLLTRLEFESLWVRNILLNSRYLPPKTNPHKAFL